MEKPTDPHQTPAAAHRRLEGQAERAFVVQRQSIDIEARTVTLAFASELPYERHWGVEVLDVAPGSIRAGRLGAGANLLMDHDARDVVGVIESVEIGADRVARAVVRFGRSARAQEVWQDVTDGIRRNVSVGYIVHKASLVETRDGLDTYRVTDWEPYEISLVSIPADPTVGVDRRAEFAPAAPTPEPQPQPQPKPTKIMSTDTIQVEQRNHAAEISKAAAALPGGADMALSAIQRGLTLEQFQTEALEKLASKPLPTADVGLSSKEARSYSIFKAINALANPTDPSLQRAAAFEREVSDAVAQKLGKQARGLMLPNEVMTRNLSAGVATEGGHTVATQLRYGSFIEMLRNAMVIDRLGVTTLTGLSGNIAIPRQSGGANAVWVAEGAAAAETQMSFGQLTMAPRTVSANTAISRRLTLQSSLDVEAMVQRDLATAVGLAIQQAAINGTGASNQPSGLMTRITPSVVGGTNGAAPTWAHIVALETNIATANADVDNMAYLTNAAVRGRLKSTSKVTGQNGFIWEGGSTAVNGYRAAVTNAVPSNLTRGTGTNLSAIIFGNFRDLVIGMWGGLDLTVDPYSRSTSGDILVVVHQDVDIAVRNVESFATMVDAITA